MDHHSSLSRANDKRIASFLTSNKTSEQYIKSRLNQLNLGSIGISYLVFTDKAW
jgi:hypothetical protein